jgi:hypothetical protein
MPQTAVSLAQVEKEVWTSDRLQKQFESRNAALGKIEAVQGVMIGRQAQTPVFPGRSGAFTSVGAGGGNLNPAQQQPVAQALWTLVYNWFQISLDTSAIAQASGQSAQSIVGAKDLEIEGAVENTRHQMSRMVVTNGDSIVAAFDTNASGNTLKLINAATEGATYGYSALVRGWLFSNMPVDIGTTADTDVLATEAVINAVDWSNPAAPTITIGGAAVATTAGTHFAFIPNPNSTTAANPELNGLRQIVSGSGALGGLNPATAGQDYWRAAFRDTTTTTFSLDLPLNLQRYVLQNSNEPGTSVWTGYKQQANFYACLRNMIAFGGDQNLSSGHVNGPTWNGMTVDAFADMLDTDWFQLTLPDLVRVKSAIDKPTWASDLEGAGGSTRWVQGTTRFVDGVVYPMQLGCQRRNTHAAATALK